MFYDCLYEVWLWMSSGGMVFCFYSYEDYDFYCVLFGRKDFIIIDEKYRNNFNFVENVRGLKIINIFLFY